MLSSSSIESYRDNGYFLLRQALSPSRLASLREGIDRVLSGWKPSGDSYERILYQIHHAWQLDGVIADTVTAPGLAQVARTLSGLEEVTVFLDQIIVKPVGGAATIPHQDAPFLSFEDEHSIACWSATACRRVRSWRHGR